jgi:outer membrane protein
MQKKIIATAAVALFSAQPAIHTAFAADLLEVYRDAMARDPVYASARATYQYSKEALPQARAGILPTVTLTGVANRNQRETEGTPKADYTANSLTLSLSQPLFRMQNFIAVDQASLQLQQSEAVFYDAQQSLIVRASQAYFDVLLAQDNVALSAAQKTAISEQLAQAKRNFEVGTSTIVDTYDAQAKYDLAVAKEISDQNDLEIKKRSLQQIIGKMPESLAQLKEQLALPLPQPDDMEQWVNAADKDSPVIAQLKAAYEIAVKEIDRNKAGHYPTLDLVGSYSDGKSPGVNSVTGQLGSNLTTRASQIGIQLSVPLYQGGGTQSKIRQAISGKDKAEQDLESTRRSVAQNVRQSFLGVTNGAAQVKAYEAALVSSKSSLDSTILGREVGVRTSVDVLNSQQQLFQARRDLQQARYSAIISQLKLKSASGHLKEEDLAEVNRLLVK